MRKAGILSNPPKIGYMIKNRLFREFITKTHVPNYILAGTLKVSRAIPASYT